MCTGLCVAGINCRGTISDVGIKCPVSTVAELNVAVLTVVLPKKARDLEFEGQRTTLWYQHSPYTSMVLGINK